MIPEHRILSAGDHRVPRPFRTFAVRSEELRHAAVARAPYGRVHQVRTGFLDPDSIARIAADGLARVKVAGFSDIDYATTDPAGWTMLAPGVADLAGSIADALRLTGVLGEEAEPYRLSVATRIDYLAACGAGFHNDVARHWPRCLFWVLALVAADVEFVMPHAGLRLAVAPGDLLVFDQTMAHGLCRPGDQGQAVAESFEADANRLQLFLTGELMLTDPQWAAIGAPWLPVAVHQGLGALDLLVAEFDERSGAVQRLNGLRGRMQPDVCLDAGDL
jgi:hypothetical protein